MTQRPNMRQPWRRCHRRQMDGFKSFGAHCSDRNSKACKQCTQSVTHSFPRRSQNGDSQQKSRSRRGVLYLLRRTWRRLRAGKPREVWACLALGVAAAYVVHRLIGWGRVASSQRRRKCPKSLHVAPPVLPTPSGRSHAHIVTYYTAQRRPPVIPKFIPQQQQR